MTLPLQSRSALLRMEHARAVRGGDARLVVAAESVLSEE
ncbi:hypothetical protein RKD18_000333 [Streptomyces phaeoluteigriseus]